MPAEVTLSDFLTLIYILLSLCVACGSFTAVMDYFTYKPKRLGK